MTTRRSRGEGGLHWDETRQRWIATASIGFDARGKRITRKAAGTTKDRRQEQAPRHAARPRRRADRRTAGYTVAEAVQDWLDYGLTTAAKSTVNNYTTIARGHIVGPLGRAKLRDLTADDIDRWLRAESTRASTRTLRLMHSLLSRVITRAMARDKVKRNVVALCTVPTGRGRRPSKSLTFNQADQLLTAAAGSPLHAYIVLSLLTGARTEEVRALRWEHVDLAGQPDATPRCPHRSRSCAPTAPPATPRPRDPDAASPCPDDASTRSPPTVRATTPIHNRATSCSAAPTGTEPDRHNVLRAFRRVVDAAGLDPPSGSPANCGTASSRSCPTAA